MIKERKMNFQDMSGNWLLPNEILLHICNFLNLEDFWNLQVTCRKFYELVCSSEKNTRSLKINTERVG